MDVRLLVETSRQLLLFLFRFYDRHIRQTTHNWPRIDPSDDTILFMGQNVPNYSISNFHS